jgi:hypothetical protein
MEGMESWKTRARQNLVKTKKSKQHAPAPPRTRSIAPLSPLSPRAMKGFQGWKSRAQTSLAKSTKGKMTRRNSIDAFTAAMEELNS